MIYKVCLILFIFLGLKQSLSEAVITYLNPPFGIKSFILRWSFYTELQISLCYKHSQKSLVPDLFTAFNLIDIFSAYCIGFCFLLVYLITQSLLLYEVGANSLCVIPGNIYILSQDIMITLKIVVLVFF